ncbi:MAG: hypothetical protein ABW005_01970 [Burkholderiaceae bacterium]
MCLLPGLLVLGGTAARADEPPAVTRLDNVEVPMQRDTAMLPYARFNEFLTVLKKHGDGLVRMDFRLRPAKPDQPLKNPKLAVASEERYIPVAVDAEGGFELPLLPPEQARGADLATNVPKGQLRVQGTLNLTMTADQLDMATVRRLMAVSHKLRSELLPWYLRWLFPQVEGVRICSAQPQWQLQWREQGQLLGLPLGADPQDRDPEADKGATSKPCTTLSGQEAWPDEARLVAPADARLSVRFRR